MPFTFSHPAIVLPFLKTKRFSATGLIIGSMCPDFEYFIRMKIQSNISHTFLGLILFNLPVGLLLAILFHLIIKRNLIENLPSFLQNRLGNLKNIDWIDHLKENFFYVLISILIGALSHIFWDSFTHESGYFVQKTPFLLHKIYDIPFYKMIQHFSSLIGMLFICFYIYKLPIGDEVETKLNWKYWGYILVLSLIFITIRWAFGLSINQTGNIVVSFISAVLLSLIFVSFMYKFINKNH